MNNASLPLNEASVRALQGYDRPVLTDYYLGTVLYNLVRAGKVEGQSLRLRVDEPEHRHYSQVVRFLVHLGVITPLRSYADGAVFLLLGRQKPSPLEVLCTTDPFAYASHLTAMEYHGLTDRVPTTIYLTSPPPAEWRELAVERMGKDLGEKVESYRMAGFPTLRRYRVTRLERRAIHVLHKKNAGAYVVTEHGHLRVSSIGRTFLDMIQTPEYCGGIRHVMDVFRTHARTYLKLLLSDVERHGAAIDKARVGYILEEECGIHDPIIDHWQETAVQRGGSRKLDAKSPYEATYSERWCLSLNHL